MSSVVRHIKYVPKGVCSRQMEFDIEDGKIKNLKVIGGCNGNLQGISRLVEGRDIDDIINCLDGVKCGMKKTSCPGQLAEALKSIRNE